MALDGTWGGHIELYALSLVLKRRFSVFNESQEIVKIEANNYPESEPLCLAYDRIKLHYSALVLINNKSDKQEFSNEKKANPRKRKHEELSSEKQDETFNEFKKFKLNLSQDKDKKLSPAIQVNFRKKKKVIKKCKEKSGNFCDFLYKSEEEIILWCLETGLLKKPKCCNECRKKSGKIIAYRLIQRKEALDNYVWKCKNKNCKMSRNLRIGNKLFESFPKISIRILLLYIFQNYCFLIPASVSRKTLNLGLKTIQKITNFINDWVVQFYQEDMTRKTKQDGKQWINYRNRRVMFFQKEI